MPKISAKPARRVLHLLCPRTKLLDVAGPLQVFRDARERDGRPAYQTQLVSVDGGALLTDVGVELDTLGLDRVRVRASDLVLVPGGPGVFAAAEDAALLRFLAERATRARALASTCTGAFLLAAAGVLDGRRAVTHWDDCDALQAAHPAVRVESDPIYVEDAGVWTSAGVTAGIDLALAWVERDLGRPAALDIARRLVVHSKRPGGQSQFSARLQQQVEDEGGDFEALHEWVHAHLDQDLRVERLAERCSMSARSFHRAYTRATGSTPARMVARLRVEAARRRLEESEDGVAAIARACGFGTEEHLRQSFQRALGLSPSAYRARWGSAGG